MQKFPALTKIEILGQSSGWKWGFQRKGEIVKQKIVAENFAFVHICS